MQTEVTASCTDSVLTLGSVAKALNEVSQSKSDYSPSSQHGGVSSSSSFYNGMDYPPLHVTVKRDPLSVAHPPVEGNKNYGQNVGSSRINSAGGRESYHNELFYREGETYDEGIDLKSSALQRQDQMKLVKEVYTGSGHGLEGSLVEQNPRYFSVALPSFPMVVVPQKVARDGQGQRERNAYVKERKTETIQKQNHDGKPIRILQRPSLTATDRHSEDETKMLDALTLLPQKRGHRKKTLSLNPEEREALENLVEEVIIGGFDEDIVSSDGSASEDEDLTVAKSIDENKKSPKDQQEQADLNTRYADQVVMEKEIKPFHQRDASDCKKNHFQKDLPLKTMNKYGRKDPRRPKENDHFGAKAKGDHRTIDYATHSKDASPNSEKEKLEARVQGLNIYPAQLKVAIKHMDSLPPRFLRRLQSGQNRMDLILPRRLEMAFEERAEQSVTENDRGKSKETQLQETKKSIRNLLCDLDQYVDEGLATPVTKESLTALPFPISPCEPPKDVGIFHSEDFPGMLKQSGSQDMASLNYLNHQPFTSRLFPLRIGPSGSVAMLNAGPRVGADSTYLDEKSSFLPKPMVYHCEEVEKLLKSGSDISTLASDSLYSSNAEAKDFVHQSMEQFPGCIPSAEEYGLYKQPANASLSGKKSQFSVDAPEFVSTLFKTGQMIDTGAMYEPGTLNMLQSGSAAGLSQPSMQLPVYTSEAEVPQDGTAHEIIPDATTSECVSRMKFLNIAGSAEPLTQYQPVPFVTSSTLSGSSAYLDHPTTAHLPSELFAPPLPCPPPPPPLPPHSSHTVVGMMHYQPYQLPPYVSSFSHPDFPLDRPNFLVPAAPNWIGEMQVPNSIPMPAMGWCSPGQAPFIDCSLGQQLPGKSPMMLCNLGQFPQDSTSSMWNCQGSYADFDALYQRVTDHLNGGRYLLVILVSGAGLDLSNVTSQLQMMTDDVVLLGACGGVPKSDVLKNNMLNLETVDSSNPLVPNPGEVRVVNSANLMPADVELKFKQALHGKRRLIVLDHVFALQPWNIQSYIVMAQGQGYQVEVVDLNEFGTYAGSEMAGSFMFEEDYQNAVMYPQPSANTQFINGGYSACMPVTRGLIHDVS